MKKAQESSLIGTTIGAEATVFYNCDLGIKLWMEASSGGQHDSSFEPSNSIENLLNPYIFK